MKKKKQTKNQATKKNNYYVHYITIAFIALVLFVSTTLVIETTRKTLVLGTATASPLLVDNGDNNQSDNQKSDNNNESNSNSNNQNQNDNQDINHEISQPETPEIHPTIQPTQGKIEIQTEGNKGELNLESAGTHIEIKKEDNGSVKITAHKSDGTEVQLQTNALDQINESLKERDIKVSTTSANGFTIHTSGVQAETNFPLSVDPSNKSLSIITPNGTTDVSTLPNQAVQNILQQKIISNLTSTNQSAASSSANDKTIALTELNNQPVYAIPGTLDKKLFGIFPMQYTKTVYVSSQTGQTIQTQESFFNKILETFSF